MNQLARRVLTLLGWLFGGLFVLLAAVSLFSDPAAGIVLLCMAAVILPPVAKRVAERIGRPIPGVLRGVVFIGLLILFGQFAEQSTQREQEATAAERADSINSAFEADRAVILDSIASHLEHRDPAAAQRIIAQYDEYVADTALDSLARRAALLGKSMADSARKVALLSQARTVPASDVRRNRDIYRELAKLDSTNRTYREKFDHYQSELGKEVAAERAWNALAGPAPQPSAWDGTYSAVKRYLEAVMNDPESLEMDGCTGVYRIDDGWLVGCDYRGRNAFGGMVRQSNWFVIRRGEVVRMEEASRYNP